MSKPQLSLQAPLNKKILGIGVGSALVLIFLFCLSYSFITTTQAFQALSRKQTQIAQYKAQQASFFPHFLSLITFKQSDTIETWKESVELLSTIDEYKNDMTTQLKGILDPNNPDANLISVEKNISTISDKLETIQTHCQNAALLREHCQANNLPKYTELSKEAVTVLRTINQEPHTFLILLQNSEELRASGGFMGSYARIDLRAGKIENITIQDIYEPDGQFTGFVDAPPGAKEYLSGGAGLRLPDANWHPDFPTSAKVISSYFAFGNERKIDSVITLNVELIEKIVTTVGEVYLPDYGVTVTADNLTALARADRNAFFAGSKQKTNFLTSLFDHLKIKITTLNADEQLEILQTLLTATHTKDLQFFSWHQPLQTIFTTYDSAGELEYRDQPDFYLYLVESNVGINKANKKITRQISFDLGANRSDLFVTFNNNDNESNLDYINYQRIIVNPAVEITQIYYQDQIIPFIETIITNSEGSEFKEVGFLLPLESGQTQTVKVTMTHPQPCLQDSCIVQIQKQSGLPPTPYQVTYGQSKIDFMLEKDEHIQID